MALTNIKKILVVDLGGMGDLLIALPALRALRDAYRSAACDVLVMDRAAPLVREAHIFDRVYLMPPHIFSALPLAGRLRRERYDLVVNMRPVASRAGALKIRALLSFIGGKIWAGRDTAGIAPFFDIAIQEPLRAEKHDREYALDLAAALGAGTAGRTVTVPVGPADDGKAVASLADAGSSGARCLIGIHPGGPQTRRWPVERFAQVMRSIAAQLPCRFVITGSGSDRRRAARLMSMPGIEALDLTGRLSFKDLVAVIRRCDLFISNDTGPLHIAAALGRPLIGLFGPGDLARFDPRALSASAVVFYEKAPCAPCDRKWCMTKRCLAAIGADAVAREALRLLQAGRETA